MKSNNNKDRMINIRIDQALDEKIQQHASDNPITISQLTRTLLEEYFSDKRYDVRDQELMSV